VAERWPNSAAKATPTKRVNERILRQNMQRTVMNSLHIDAGKVLAKLSRDQTFRLFRLKLACRRSISHVRERMQQMKWPNFVCIERVQLTDGSAHVRSCFLMAIAVNMSGYSWQFVRLRVWLLQPKLQASGPPHANYAALLCAARCSATTTPFFTNVPPHWAPE
jgi:hypothetical protein